MIHLNNNAYKFYCRGGGLILDHNRPSYVTEVLVRMATKNAVILSSGIWGRVVWHVTKFESLLQPPASG